MLRLATGLQLTNKYKVSSCMLAVSAGMTGMLTGASAVAAETAGESAPIQEIVVTANKLNAQRVLDVPASIQAISGDSLQRAGSSAFMDIAGQILDLPARLDDLEPSQVPQGLRGARHRGLDRILDALL